MQVSTRRDAISVPDSIACTVVTVGLPARPSFVAGQPPVATPQQLSPPAILDMLRPVLDAGRRVVVVLPSSDDEARRAVEVARSALDLDRVVLYATDLPPLAGAVLVGLAATIASDGVSAGPLAAALPALEREILPIAWLGSVSKLDRLTPSMRQHVRSLLPGAGFLAYGGPNARVERVSRTEPRITLPLTAANHRIALAPADRGDRAWVEQALMALGMAGRTVLSPPTTDGPEWWGTDRLVELAVYPTDRARLLEVIDPHPEPCPWCGQPVASDPCPLCGMRRASVLSRKEVS